MTFRVVLAAATLVTITTAAAQAGDVRGRDIDHRQEVQSRAIMEGRRDGGITWLEAYRLRKEQARIAALEAKFKRDGVLTRSEREILRQAQTDAGRHITSERRDEQVRGWWWRTFVR